jgi:DNA polymerase-4
MPSITAYHLCPSATFVKPRIEVYREVSTLIREIFSHYTEIFEPLSLDEAYLDVTQTTLCQGSATLIAQQIKADIKQQTQLTASAGISYNKFLAKIASDKDKPIGLYLIKPEQGALFVENLNVREFHGIGKATYKKMNALGITTGRDLKKYSLAILQQNFGKVAQHYYNICRGIDYRPVIPNRESKSVGVEITFATDILGKQQALTHLKSLLKKVLIKLEQKQLMAQTLTVKIKYHDFVQITRSRTLSKAILIETDTFLLLESLLQNTEIDHRKIRLLGVSLSSLNNKSLLKGYQQRDIFDDFFI